MKKYKIDDFTRGWFVGNFSPTLLSTENVEVAYKKYKSGDKEEKHYHKIATETTLMTKGKVSMNEQIFEKGEIIIVSPNEIVNFKVIEDAENIVIKIPGVNNDKYILKENKQ